MDHIKNFFEDVKQCNDGIRKTFKGYPMLNYAFNLMKCFILFELGVHISPQAAFIQCLFFVTAFILSQRSHLSLSRTIGVLLAQCFWVLTAHSLKNHFVSNVVTSMIMVLNGDFETQMNGILVTRVFQLIFQYGPKDQDLLCISVTAVSLMTWYAACCIKWYLDILSGVLICFSCYALHPKLFVTSDVQGINPVDKLSEVANMLGC